MMNGQIVWRELAPIMDWHFFGTVKSYVEMQDVARDQGDRAVRSKWPRRSRDILKLHARLASKAPATPRKIRARIPPRSRTFQIQDCPYPNTATLSNLPLRLVMFRSKEQIAVG
jgi:hypothetical protein